MPKHGVPRSRGGDSAFGAGVSAFAVRSPFTRGDSLDGAVGGDVDGRSPFTRG